MTFRKLLASALSAALLAATWGPGATQALAQTVGSAGTTVGSVPGAAGSLVVVLQTVKGRKRRVLRKVETVLRDKMGNIIKGKGAKARAAIEAKQKTETKK